MNGEELPPLVLSLSKDTSGGRALETMSVWFLSDHYSGDWTPCTRQQNMTHPAVDTRSQAAYC